MNIKNFYEIKNRIKSFEELEEGWDLYGSEPLSKITILKACGFLYLLQKFNNILKIKNLEVFPSPRDTINFEFESDDMEIEIEVGNKLFIYLIEDKDGNYIEKNVLEDSLFDSFLVFLVDKIEKYLEPYTQKFEDGVYYVEKRK